MPPLVEPKWDLGLFLDKQIQKCSEHTQGSTLPQDMFDFYIFMRKEHSMQNRKDPAHMQPDELKWLNDLMTSYKPNDPEYLLINRLKGIFLSVNF